MKIVVKHAPAYRFEAINETGNTVLMDASPAVGGEGTGMRPMEMLLAGLGGCSGIDVVSILKKKKQDFTALKVEVYGDRNPEEVPSLFKKIRMEFYLDGENIENAKMIRAVELSVQKYCSVAKTLEKTAVINYTIFVNNEKIQEVTQ